MPRKNSPQDLESSGRKGKGKKKKGKKEQVETAQRSIEKEPDGGEAGGKLSQQELETLVEGPIAEAKREAYEDAKRAYETLKRTGLKGLNAFRRRFQESKGFKYGVIGAGVLAGVLALGRYGCPGGKVVVTSSSQVSGQSLESTLREIKGHVVLQKGSYNFDYDVFVSPEGTLEIEPGAELRFSANTGLLSFGTLKARGTERERIVFSGYQAERWSNVTLAGEDSSSSILEYFMIRGGSGLKKRLHAKGSFGGLKTDKTVGGGLLIMNSSPQICYGIIENCVAGFEGGGVYLMDFNGVVEKCTIRSNKSGDYGGGLALQGSCLHARIIENEITGNEAKYRGGGISACIDDESLKGTWDSDNGILKKPDNETLIQGNIFLGNSASMGDRNIFSAINCSRPDIRDNTEK